MIPFIIIGHSDNRRVGSFVEALSKNGHPSPTVVSHRDALDDPPVLAGLPDSPAWVRLESVGESAAFEQRLLELGYDGAPTDVDVKASFKSGIPHGALVAPRQHYRGFCRYLDRLQAIFTTKPQWRVLQPPATVKRLFDKNDVWARHRAAGLPVAEALPTPVHHPDQLRDAMTERGWPTVYVKLRSGSSASGLAVFMREPRERLMTTAAFREGRWFNTLRMQRLDQRPAIDRALAFLLSEGAHVERALPKARLDGALFDLRVLTIKGEPTFTVVRQSRHPVTNLHLGGWRGRLEILRAATPSRALTAMYASCRKAAAQHDCFHIGFDVLFTPGFRSHAIIEANAFGDLLPRLFVDGRSVYETQIDRLQET